MKIFNKLFICTLIIFFAFSCKEEEDVLVYDGPVLGHFTSPTGAYFVKSDDTGYEVVVGVTKAPSSSVTFNISIDEANTTAIEGTEFTLESTTVTIPAGEVVGSVKLLGDFNELSSTPKTITLILEGGSAGLADFYLEHSLSIQQFCAYEQADFVGTWYLESEGFGNFNVEIVAGADPNEVIVKDIFGYGLDQVIVLDDSNPTSFTAKVSKQNTWVSGTYGDAYSEGSGVFSACDLTIDLDVEYTVEAGSFGTYKEFYTKL